MCRVGSEIGNPGGATQSGRANGLLQNRHTLLQLQNLLLDFRFVGTILPGAQACLRISNQFSHGYISGAVIDDTIARGGMDVTYRARQKSLERILALETSLRESVARRQSHSELGVGPSFHHL